MEGISTLPGLGVDLVNIFVVGEFNGDMRPFWGCNVEKNESKREFKGKNDEYIGMIPRSF
jgi:hypothetical protein